MVGRTIHDEPVRGRYLDERALSMSGIDLMRAFASGAVAPPLTRLTGLMPTEVGPGMSTFAMPASPWWQTAAGVFPAGVFAFLADGPLGSSVLSSLPAGTGITTSQLNIDFLRTATVRSGTLIAKSRVVHLTKALALSEVTVEDSRGRALAHGTARNFLIAVDASMLPEQGPEVVDDGSPDPYLRPVEGQVRPQEYWNAREGSQVMAEWEQGEMVPPVSVLLGIEDARATDAGVEGRLRNSPWTRNGFGVMYGGTLAAAADMMMSAAVLQTMPAATAFAPLDLKVSFLRPVRPTDSDLTMRSWLSHRGRSIHLAMCEIATADGKRVATATESFLVLPGRPWDRAIAVSEERVPPG